MNIEAALREWEAQCWEQYNHENDYIEPQESEVKENDKRRNQHLF